MYELNYKHLLAEKNSLERMIAEAKNPNSISIRSLKARLQDVIDEISHIDPSHLTKKAVITFRGRPVDGSKSINADFSAKALEGLTNMVASVAASANHTLNYFGAIPNKNRHTLKITGIAVGSFGFELSLPAPQDDLIDGQKNDTEETITNIQTLLQYGLTGTDEQISDLVETIHPRAINNIRNFLSLMKDQEALFALQLNNTTTRIETNKQLLGLIERFSDENIQEKEETYRGRFIGVLPKTRTFEFQDDSKHIIKGKIGAHVQNPAYINQEYLDKPVTVSFHTVRVGNAKPKYKLMDIANIS